MAAETATSPSQPLLEMRGITKAFGAVQALRGVDLDVAAGEVVALVGDNGAGKSTLMKVLAGVVTPDGGEVRMRGETVRMASPEDARARGIEMIYQDLALFNDADIAWNVFAGRELTVRRGPLKVLDGKEMHRRANALLAGLGIDLGPTSKMVGGLSGGQRQMVAITRALAFSEGEQLLIMDEPTAALGQAESGAVHQLIRSLRDQREVAIVLISHRLPEVLDLTDRIVVLRRGESVASCSSASSTVESLVNLIVAGRPPARVPDPEGGAVA